MEGQSEKTTHSIVQSKLSVIDSIQVEAELKLLFAELSMVTTTLGKIQDSVLVLQLSVEAQL